MIINHQLQRLGPSIIVRPGEKDYYKSFGDYRESKNTKTIEKILALYSDGITPHSAVTYFRGEIIIPLAEYTETLFVGLALQAARRQKIPAFREKGVWKISRL